MLNKLKYIFIIVIILFCINYAYVYKVAKTFQNQFIEQFEFGYLNYLDYINDGSIYSINNAEISDNNLLIKDSIDCYIKAKEGIKELKISDERVELKLDITNTFIMPNFLNKIYIKFGFIEKAFYNNNQIYYLGNKGNYDIQLIKEKGEWKVEYIVKYITEPYKYA